VTLLAHLFLAQRQQKSFLLVVVRRMTREAGHRLVGRVLTHQVLVTLAAALAHNGGGRPRKTKNPAGVPVTVYVRSSRAVARLATSTFGMFLLQ